MLRYNNERIDPTWEIQRIDNDGNDQIGRSASWRNIERKILEKKITNAHGVPTKDVQFGSILTNLETIKDMKEEIKKQTHN